MDWRSAWLCSTGLLIRRVVADVSLSHHVTSFTRRKKTGLTPYPALLPEIDLQTRIRSVERGISPIAAVCTVLLSWSRDPGHAHIGKFLSGVISELSLGTRLPNLKFVSSAVLELLAFNAQQCTGSRDRDHAHFLDTFVRGHVARPRKPPGWCKFIGCILYKLSCSQFCVQKLSVGCHGNKGRRETNFNDTIRLPDPENPLLGANILALSLKVPEL